MGNHEQQMQQQQQQQYYQESSYGSQYPPIVAEKAAQPTGTKRGVLFGLIGAVALLAALVIGLGAGLGVTRNKLNTAETDLAAAMASFAAGPPATVTVTAPASTPTVIPPKVDCPASNNTIYIAAEGDKQFNRFCGIDFSGEGAKDVGSVEAESMVECMDACAGNSTCQGCGWGILDKTKTKQQCYLKTNLTRSHQAVPGWGFAVLANITFNSTA